MESTTSTPLRAALENLRLDGALFFRAAFTENWAFESPFGEVKRALRPEAKSMILFHIVAAGRCWISVQAVNGTGPTVAMSSCCPTATPI